MKKLVKGVVDFREQVRSDRLEHFEQLSLGQSPDTLLVTCSDSRVAVNVFASTNPGDVFVLRNIGNLIPPVHSQNENYSKAAIDFAIDALKISHILVCGHSECGAMIAIHQGVENQKSEGIREWLKNGIEKKFSPYDYNELSRKNVLFQLEHLMSYEKVKTKVESGSLQLHAWWFDIKNADVFYFSAVEGEEKTWVLIDAISAEKILIKL